VPSKGALNLPEEVISSLPRWKALYGSVHCLPAGGTIFVFRDLSFSEIDEYNNLVTYDSTEAENRLLASVLLFPKNTALDAMPAWSVSKILEKVHQSSGTTDASVFIAALEKHRAEAATLQGMALAYVASAFKIPIHDVRAMPMSKLAEYVALSEIIIGRQIEIVPQGKKKKRSPFGPRQPQGDDADARREHLRSVMKARKAGAPPEPRETGASMLKPMRGGTPGISAPLNLDPMSDNKAMRDFGF